MSKLEDYENLLKNDKCLGKGAYGYVTLVQHKNTKETYAMKIVSKKFVEKHGGSILLLREIENHKDLIHPHIIRLYESFSDEKNVYLLMEYAENGNLYKYMKRQGLFSEKESFSVFLQVCLGIEFLHRNNIIHRDLKPENLQIDTRKRIKICDFGWSAENNSKQNRKTFCGTADYMAPEILLGKNQSFSVDLWCQGILLYELLHGKPPYHEEPQHSRLEKMKNSSPIKFDDKISSDCKHLINSLLAYDPEMRPTLNTIFEHPWVREREHSSYLNTTYFRNNHNLTIYKNNYRQDKTLELSNQDTNKNNKAQDEGWKKWEKKYDTSEAKKWQKYRLDKEENMRNQLTTYKNDSKSQEFGEKKTVGRLINKPCELPLPEDDDNQSWFKKYFSVLCCSHREVKK